LHFSFSFFFYQVKILLERLSPKGVSKKGKSSLLVRSDKAKLGGTPRVQSL
jgi:hypothetical protein